MIDDHNTLALLAVILGIVWFGYQCEKTRWGAKLSAPLIILLTSFALGNLGVLPNSSGVYTAIQAVLVPLAIPLLLFGADIKKAIKESGYMLLAFGLAVTVTIIGAIVGLMFIDMGPSEAQLVGVLTASYIGGSANFVATSEAVGFSDSSLYVSALTGDAIGAMFFLTALMLLPAIGFIARRFTNRESPGGKSSLLPRPGSHSQTVTEKGLVASLALSAAIGAIGYAIATAIPVEGMFIIAITVLSLLVANFAPKKWLSRAQFDYQAGTILMYIFFATIGAGADISAMAESALPIIFFLMILVIVHIVLLVFIGAWLKLELAELMVASSACILGPSAAAALAAGQGWRHLVTPGMLVGVLGYAIATFIGIALTAIVS